MVTRRRVQQDWSSIDSFWFRLQEKKRLGVILFYLSDSFLCFPYLFMGIYFDLTHFKIITHLAQHRG